MNGPREQKETLSHVAALELFSTDAPDNIEARLELISAYRSAGLSDAAKAELARLSRMCPQHPLTMAEGLRALLQQQAMPSLNAALAKAHTIPDPPLALRLAMGTALTRIRQFERAAVHFATILASEPIPDEALGPLAEFVRLHPEEGPVASALERILRASDYTELPTLLQYAVVRSLIESRPRRASELLQCIQVEDVDTGEVALDLAVQAFRLTDWVYAVEASTHALSLCPGQRVPERVLVSALSFAGQLEEARDQFRSSDDAPTPVHVRVSQLSALKFLASQHKGSRPVCAVVVGDDDPRTPCKLITRDLEELSGDLADLPRDPGSSITVSVVGSAYEDCGPWEVLAEIDWRVPHLMIQHLDAGPILHAFVGANEAPDSWAWQEVPVAFSAESASGEAEFSFLAAEGQLPGDCVPATNSLWRRIEPELDSLNPRIGVKR